MEQNRHSGGERPGALDAAANNTDLWTVYLRAQARSWVDPLGLASPEAVDVVARPLADMTAALMSGWVSLLTGPTVRAMYDGNKQQVTQFVNEQAIDPDAIEIPADYVRPARRPASAPTQLEEWAVTEQRDLVPA